MAVPPSRGERDGGEEGWRKRRAKKENGGRVYGKAYLPEGKPECDCTFKVRLRESLRDRA